MENMRTPVGDVFFSLITHMGEETIFILVGLLFFWCIDKKKGYFLLSVGFIGTVINQFLKLWFRIPRPWVKNPNFTIVESARAEATGYSFPSGHTQTSVGMYGGIARVCKNLWVRIPCILLCILVPLSRMYLGVHTPADVGVSVAVALVLIFVLYPVVNKVLEKPKYMRIYLAVLIALAAAFLAFVLLYPFPADIDMHNYESGIKNAYKILGCILGLWVSFEIDEHYTHFETKGSWWVQILKLVPGLLVLLAIKSGLKAPLYALCGGSFIADGIRYFLITAVAGGVWPMTFKLWSKLDKK
ncbi:MAG: phosphatase PAP2 family protein [Lachnospiraceae bacterium]|nr:phosphatase PAP2 family protein [Lachnospiraceae bacterium]